MGWIWSGCHQPVNLILLPSPSPSPRLLYHFCLSRTTAAAPLPPSSSGFERFCHRFRSDFFLFFAVAVDRKKDASKQLHPCVLGGPQRFTRFSQRGSSRSAETLKKEKKQTIAFFWSFQEHTHTHRQTHSLVTSQMSISNHSQTKLLPTLFTDILSLVSRVGSAVTCYFDTWQLPFLPSTCLRNLTGSLKASVHCVLIISNSICQKEYAYSEHGGDKLYPMQPLLCGVTFPLQNFTYTLGLLEAPINFQTRCKCVWKERNPWFMVISYGPYSHSRHCPLTSRSGRGSMDAELSCVCFRGCTSYKSMESDKLLLLHRLLIEHQQKRQWTAKI